MDIDSSIKDFTKRIVSIKDNIKTEESAKTSLILPFFQLLGYDVFNPYEFVPEFTADTGTKKGEKVDYAILINNEPTILIEAKALDKDLNKHLNQLYRYFSVTKAKFAILTNGILYRFYTDLDEPNKMDELPFLEINLLQLKEDDITQLQRFTKDVFDMKGILDIASNLKYTALIKNVLAEQLTNPSDQFIKLILSKGIYPGVKTQTVIDKFKDIVKLSFNQYISDLVNEKIKNALDNNATNSTTSSTNDLPKSAPTLSEAELYILDFVKSLITSDISEDRIYYKKTERYVTLILDNNIRKWICRIYLKQNTTHTFQLHQINNEPLECEYLFEEAYQLNQIKDIILNVAKNCNLL